MLPKSKSKLIVRVQMLCSNMLCVEFLQWQTVTRYNLVWLRLASRKPLQFLFTIFIHRSDWRTYFTTALQEWIALWGVVGTAVYRWPSNQIYGPQVHCGRAVHLITTWSPPLSSKLQFSQTLSFVEVETDEMYFFHRLKEIRIWFSGFPSNQLIDHPHSRSIDPMTKISFSRQ